MFNPRDWYWIVGASGPHLPDADAAHPAHDRVYSSSRGAYVEVSDPTYREWREAQLAAIPYVLEPATRIAYEAELDQVLRQYDMRLAG
jgi:hypothetical protein